MVCVWVCGAYLVCGMVSVKCEGWWVYVQVGVWCVGCQLWCARCVGWVPAVERWVYCEYICCLNLYVLLTVA